MSTQNPRRPASSRTTTPRPRKIAGRVPDPAAPESGAEPAESEPDELPEVPPVRSGPGVRCFVPGVPGDVQERESACDAEQVQQPRPAGEPESTERRCDEQHRRRHEQHQGCPGCTVEGSWFHAATLAGASSSAALWCPAYDSGPIAPHAPRDGLEARGGVATGLQSVME